MHQTGPRLPSVYLSASPSPPSVVSESGKLCPQCGKHNIQTAHFCTNCGQRLNQQPVLEPAALHPGPVQQGLPYPALVRSASKPKKPWYPVLPGSGHQDKPAIPRLLSHTLEQVNKQGKRLLEAVRAKGKSIAEQYKKRLRAKKKYHVVAESGITLLDLYRAALTLRQQRPDVSVRPIRFTHLERTHYMVQVTTSDETVVAGFRRLVEVARDLRQSPPQERPQDVVQDPNMRESVFMEYLQEEAKALFHS